MEMVSAMLEKIEMEMDFSMLTIAPVLRDQQVIQDHKDQQEIQAHKDQ